MSQNEQIKTMALSCYSSFIPSKDTERLTLKKSLFQTKKKIRVPDSLKKLLQQLRSNRDQSQRSNQNKTPSLTNNQYKYISYCHQRSKPQSSYFRSRILRSRQEGQNALRERGAKIQMNLYCTGTKYFDGSDMSQSPASKQFMKQSQGLAKLVQMKKQVQLQQKELQLASRGKEKDYSFFCKSLPMEKRKPYLSMSRKRTSAVGRAESSRAQSKDRPSRLQAISAWQNEQHHQDKYS